MQPDILKVRESLHHFIDPMWESGWRSRESIYREMSSLLHKEAHVSKMDLKELERVAKYFIEKYKESWPCASCSHCVAYRHFLPVCDLNQQRKEDRCAKQRLTNNI